MANYTIDFAMRAPAAAPIRYAWENLRATRSQRLESRISSELDVKRRESRLDQTLNNTHRGYFTARDSVLESTLTANYRERQQ